MISARLASSPGRAKNVGPPELRVMLRTEHEIIPNPDAPVTLQDWSKSPVIVPAVGESNRTFWRLIVTVVDPLVPVKTPVIAREPFSATVAGFNVPALIGNHHSAISNSLRAWLDSRRSAVVYDSSLTRSPNEEICADRYCARSVDHRRRVAGETRPGYPAFHGRQGY